MRRVVAGHRKLTTNQLRASSKLILSQLHEKLLKNSTSTILQSFGIWSKLERWKSSVSGCLMSRLQIKKSLFWSVIFLFYATTMNHFSIGLWHVKQSGFYMTTSDDQLSGWTEKLQTWWQNSTLKWWSHSPKMLGISATKMWHTWAWHSSWQGVKATRLIFFKSNLDIYHYAVNIFNQFS